MGLDILVDGYNMIKRAPSFQAVRMQSLASARAQLIALLVNRYRHTPHQVIVVFDGDETNEQVSHDRRIRIIYSRHGETADSVIARLASEARRIGREVEIYSDDREVRESAASQGGVAQTTCRLEQQFYAAPRDVERRGKHRLKMRRKYGLDPQAFVKDADEIVCVPGKKKRKRHQ